MKKQILSLCLASTLCMSMVPTSAFAAQANFTDVPAEAWYSNYVQTAASSELMTGVDTGKFDPDGFLTRAMFVTVLGRLAGVNEADYTGTSFDDVEAGQWYSPFVEWAAKSGITNGITDKLFGTNDKVTREQAATMIGRYIETLDVQLESAENPAVFPDSSKVSTWAASYVDALRTAGIVSGYEDSTFRPADTATRAQAAKIFVLLDNAIDSAKPGLPDLLVAAGETKKLTENISCDNVEIEGTITADVPVICFFTTSSTVKNGDIINNVQFVSDYDEVIAVVHTNDVHGHIDVEPYVKGFADELKASGDYSLVLTVSGGDVYGGGEAVAGSYNGEMIPALMDQVYDIVVPGNNDFGSTGVVSQNLMLTALYDHSVTLCANVLAKDGGIDLASYASSYTSKIGGEMFSSLYPTVTADKDGKLDLSALNLGKIDGGVNPYQATIEYTTTEGTKIGLYGITTSGGACETQVDCLGSIETAQNCVDTLTENGASVIIGIGHTGWMGEGSSETSSNDTNSWQLAATVTGEDAFIDAHTHSIINEGEGVLVGDDGEFVNQAQCFGGCIGVCYLYINDGEVVAKDGEVITTLTTITPDASVQSTVDTLNAKVASELGAVLATTPYFLNGERLSANNPGGTVRGNETNLGDLMTDIILDCAEETTGDDYDFVSYPGFWLRASIEAGDITLANIQSVFGNPTVLNTVDYSAQDVVDMVTKGLGSVYPDKEDTTFNHYSGITVTYTYSEGTGTPVTITVGDLLIYDANNGGLQDVGDKTFHGIYTLTGGEIDKWTGSTDTFLCASNTEVQNMVADYLKTHTQGVDYVIHENTVAPDNRIVAIQ